MKQKKKQSIVARIFFLLSLIIFLQGFISLHTILFTDIATTVETFSYNSFTRTVINRKNNLEIFMTSSWSNINDISLAVSQQYQEVRGDNKELTEDEKVVFLLESTEYLMQMVTMTGTTGGFLILDDGEDMKYSYSTVYLKSYDNITQVGNADNLMLARGPAEVSKKNDFSLVSNWSYGLELTEDNFPILQMPMEAALQTSNLEYLAYWHVSNDITNSKLKVLTCSVPILDENNQAIGVVGVEISQEYLYKFLPDNEFGDTGSHGYVLASRNNNTTLVPLVVNGSILDQVLTVDQPVSLRALQLENHDLDAIPQLIYNSDPEICIYTEPLSLYANNSPFPQEDIWIVGMVDLENLTSFTTQFWKVISSMLAATILAGIALSYIVGLQVANPILKLSKTVSRYDVQKKVYFEPTNVREIDELAHRIEQMQENILRSAHRTDKILELLNIGVGSFEYIKGEEMVTVSGSVCKMLDLEQSDSIPEALFFHKLTGLKENPTEEVAHTYTVAGVETRYYKVEEFHQGSVLLGVIQDTTKDVEDLLVLNYERNYDLLTGIFNRRAFHQKVEEIMANEPLNIAGFVMFDLDNLKYVNDTFGHDSGDVYIKTAATTIHQVLHKNGVVGRMSGDEFYAFLYGFNKKEDLMERLHLLYAQFDEEPIEMPNSELFKIRVSGGIAWYGQETTDLEELKKYADFAMYKGKHTLKGEMRQFDMEMYEEESFMISGKAELDLILDQDLMKFVFQPIIDVATGTIHGYEALMRPQSELLASPLKLLQLATLEGKLGKVEKIALFKTLALFHEYRHLFQGAKLFVNSIPTENLKAEEYAQLQTLYPDLLPNVVVEITEQDQQDELFLQEKLTCLRSLGGDIAIDDYGSGYANDMALVKIKPDLVKIDRSLISNVHVDPSRQSIVHKIISICRDEGVKVLGEGIETEQELDYLLEAGIDYAQGYYVSRPMERPDFDYKVIQDKIQELRKKS